MPTPIGAPTETDVLIAGGGTGGVAAVLAACRAGLTVVLTEETDWIGGQLTSQAVPPDEHPWVEQFGVTDTYRSLRDSDGVVGAVLRRQPAPGHGADPAVRVVRRARRPDPHRHHPALTVREHLPVHPHRGAVTP